MAGPHPKARSATAHAVHGHVMEMSEAGQDPAATTFGWNILLLCGDPNDPSTYFAGADRSKV